MPIDIKNLRSRQIKVGFITAAICGAGVYLIHSPVHSWLHAVTGSGEILADSVGTVTIVLLSFFISGTVSFGLFKDSSMGMDP